MGSLPNEDSLERLVTEILNFNSDMIVTVDNISSIDVNACMNKLAKEELILMEMLCFVQPMGYQLWYLSNLINVKLEGSDKELPVQANIFAVLHFYELLNSVVILPIKMWNKHPVSKGIMLIDHSKRGDKRNQFFAFVSTYTAITKQNE